MICLRRVWRRNGRLTATVATIALQKQLAPSSKVHEGWSVSDLQQVVLVVKAVLDMSGRYPKIDRDEEPD